ncbi:MAG: redoxin domain-containing protein [Alphaproteobacteria bacterium]|nr:redoxin domain-containing protein [Alphaproteobacteria bacterium]
MVLSLSLLLACGGANSGDDGFGGGGDGGDSGVTDGGATGGGGGGGGGTEEVGSIPATVVDAEVTWSLDFDEEAEAAGFADCTYSRTFSGTQVLDLDYVCPDCDVIVRGEALMTEGIDCAAIISTDPEEVRTELWGWSHDGTFFRSGRDQYPMGDLTTVEGVDGDSGTAELAWESDYTLTDGGAMVLSASGSMTFSIDEDQLLPDPFPERTEPYACGWPTADPGTLTLDYELAIGGTLPNARFVDQCGEKLALWDLYGRWLVIDTAQPDCGPCRNMAQTADAFVEEMAAEGIEVVPVTLLGAGLGEPFVTPEEDVLADWVEAYGDSNPVLFDRGYGYALLPEFMEAETGEGFGYPAWIIVSPEMEIVHANVGFGSWDAMAEVIRGMR